MNTSGDRLRALLQECDLTPSDFAVQRKLTPQHVNNWFKRGVPQARLDELSALFCVHRRWLQTGEGPKHPDPLVPARRARPRTSAPSAPLLELQAVGVQVPLHQVSEAGLEPVPGLYQTLPSQALASVGVMPSQCICLGMPGPNMAPLLPQGTLLAVDRSFTRVVAGEYYALLHNGRLRVHQLTHGPSGTLCLHSHDRLNYPVERYSPQRLKSQRLEVIGWVFWWSCLRTERPG